LQAVQVRRDLRDKVDHLELLDLRAPRDRQDLLVLEEMEE